MTPEPRPELVEISTTWGRTLASTETKAACNAPAAPAPEDDPGGEAVAVVVAAAPFGAAALPDDEQAAASSPTAARLAAAAARRGARERWRKVSNGMARLFRPIRRTRRQPHVQRLDQRAQRE
ncbi:MAG: hypothetical protein ACYCTI_00120 [Acidimicrobiales bacterium]